MNTKYSIEVLEDATEKLKAIAHPLRILMVDLLHKETEMSVTEIYETLGIEQAIASHHLRILKSRDIVKVSRDGKNSNYSLTNSAYINIIHSIMS
jgi:ArsR family transcriptional regulator